MKMRQKVAVKVFLPTTESSAPANETEFLCGEIKCELENDRGCQQILVFITSRRPNRVHCDAGSQQCVGEINARQTAYDQGGTVHDYIWLEHDPNARDVIRLKNICLPVSMPDAECQLKVQIILYEPQKFRKLSNGDDELPSSTSAQDPIVHLIKLLRRSEQPNKSPGVWCDRMQQFLWIALMAINRIVFHKLRRINESALLRHFSIWLNSMKLFTFKRFVTISSISRNEFSTNRTLMLQWKGLDDCIRCCIRYDFDVDFAAGVRSG